MNKKNHTATIPMEEYLELLENKEDIDKGHDILNLAFVELYDRLYLGETRIPNKMQTTNFEFARDIDPKTGKARVRFMKITKP